ncbi:hypothetical protein PQG02_37050 (plasmid) [Nostoc sp. UHCC 0926]|uniref:hypothetical protein n=1 Tax=Nostoc sp. UHCC 0926 TaxID=3025190 RepID=UPI00235F08FD|nr:hypothetical protein [Nostoc sp. UHCC 0926]WDD37074.1 hypothetical protein PQG02_37050 [Nostoc sp. UHCC 0926]
MESDRAVGSITSAMRIVLHQICNTSYQGIAHWHYTEAANAVGYSNTGHFAAVFKRKYGIIPRECFVGKKPIPPFGIEIPPL